MVKFCVESVIDDEPYPNLATVKAKPFTDEWTTFSTITPYSEPVVLFKHLDRYKIPYSIVSLDEADCDTFYPIALSYFDFSIDWFSLMSKKLIKKLKEKNIKILFYYSEGDNPFVIDEHITQQCKDNKIPRDQIKFVSANSRASEIDNFIHVVDDEILFHYRNRKHPPGFYHEEERSKKFTALVRMHKWWRANTMASIWQKRLDTDGYFAYGDEIDSGENEKDNPIQIDSFMGLRQCTSNFISGLPFKADNLDSDGHNDHTLQVREHFEDAYINIVLESHMDVDRSDGVFITEKTFKPIKNSQLFVIFGAKGTLQQLREMGYKTFDDILDNSYDEIEDTTERWKTCIDMVCDLLENPKYIIHNLYIKAQEQIIHNQDLFNASKESRINNIIEAIQND